MRLPNFLLRSNDIDVTVRVLQDHKITREMDEIHWKHGFQYIIISPFMIAGKLWNIHSSPSCANSKPEYITTNGIPTDPFLSETPPLLTIQHGCRATTHSSQLKKGREEDNKNRSLLVATEWGVQNDIKLLRHDSWTVCNDVKLLA